ncbi:chromate transporter [Anaerosporobacter faecicola]|uniref:chromate transporter n=1 Tax=Anaerosporobacter faecicola TaxID=2718714 RepID=UPI00143B8CA8|nr:chromate transporter [Anaerosporobacter faecicola]
MKNHRVQLFLTFLKIGGFTFGGGYAMIPLIRREVVDRGWISEEDMMDIIAVSESTPGPFAVNSATFVGYQVGGFLGAAMATLGVVLPSFFIILTISFFLRQFEALKAVQYAFQGIRAGVLMLIVNASLSLFRQCRKNWFSYSIMVVTFVCTGFLSVSAVILLIVCGVVGYLYSSRKESV